MDRACFDHYPSWIVVLSNLAGLGIWALGAFILSGFGVFWSFPYLAYCIWLEFRLLKHSCTDCYYYGRVCAFGKGVLCALLFRKGDPRQFANRQISWKHLVPDFIVPLAPVAGGIALLIREFSWLVVFLLAALLLLSSWGNGFVRGKLACRYCRQKDIGCPAAMLFAGMQGRTSAAP